MRTGVRWICAFVVAFFSFVVLCVEGAEVSESEAISADASASSADSEASAVLHLDGAGFEEALITHGALFVAFFAPWCGHSKALAVDWHKAASKLKGRLQFVSVDATIERSLAEQYDIGAYPTIKFVRYEGDDELYTGGRKTEDLIKWGEAHVEPSVIRIEKTSYSMYPEGVVGCAAGTEILTKDECQEAIEALGLLPNPIWASNYEGLPRFCSFRETGDEHMHWNSASKGTGRSDLAPVCHTDSEDPAGINELLRARSISKTLFLAVGDADFFQRFSVVADSVRRSGGSWVSRVFAFAGDPANRLEVIRGITERVVFEGDLSDAAALEAFVRAEALPLFGEVDDDSAPAYLEAAETGKGLLWLCLERPRTEDDGEAENHARQSFWEVAESLGTLARGYRGKVPFVWLDAAAHALQAEQLGCGPGRPAVVVDLSDGPDEASRYRLDLPADFAPRDIGIFLESVLAGEVFAEEETEQDQEWEELEMDVGEMFREEGVDESDDFDHTLADH